MKYFLLYGLQRSGTNYLEYLMKENFKGFEFKNNGYARSLPVHKHFRLYDNKSFVPEPKYLNNFFYPDFNTFDQHAKELTQVNDINYIFITKEPYSWYLSFCREAKKNKWPTLLKKHVNNHYMTDYSMFCEKWLQFENESEKVIHIQYEELVKDFNGTLDKIQKIFDLEKMHSDYANLTKVPKSKKFTKKKKSFYEKGEFKQLFTEDELFVLTKNLDAKVIKELRYKLLI
jgi:hypothetical protein